MINLLIWSYQIPTKIDQHVDSRINELINNWSTWLNMLMPEVNKLINFWIILIIPSWFLWNVDLHRVCELINCWSTSWIHWTSWAIVDQLVHFLQTCRSTVDKLVDSHKKINLLLNCLRPYRCLTSKFIDNWSTYWLGASYSSCWSLIAQHVELKNQHVDQ